MNEMRTVAIQTRQLVRYACVIFTIRAKVFFAFILFPLHFYIPFDSCHFARARAVLYRANSTSVVFIGGESCNGTGVLLHPLLGFPLSSRSQHS